MEPTLIIQSFEDCSVMFSARFQEIQSQSPLPFFSLEGQISRSGAAASFSKR